jgi:hypothetical protein
MLEPISRAAPAGRLYVPPTIFAGSVGTGDGNGAGDGAGFGAGAGAGEGAGAGFGDGVGLGTGALAGDEEPLGFCGASVPVDMVGSSPPPHAADSSMAAAKAPQVKERWCSDVCISSVRAATGHR